MSNSGGTVIQKTHYYPFGSSFGVATVSSTQPYRYNGKELDQMHRLNLYDSGARFYDSALGRTSTIDPHAENYYSWSPYSWVANNPLRITDPTGMDWYQDYKSGAAFWQEGDVNHIDRDGLRYYNIGSTYNQKVDDYTFLHYNQDTPTTYYFPDDFQNGDLVRNAQIS